MTYQEFLDYADKASSDTSFRIVERYDADKYSGFYGDCVQKCNVQKDEKMHFLNHVNVNIKRLYEKENGINIPDTCCLCNCCLNEWCKHTYHYYCCYGCKFSHGNTLENDDSFIYWKKTETINFKSSAVVNCHQVKLVAWVLAAICGYKDKDIDRINEIQKPFTRAKELRYILNEHFSSR